MLLNVIWNLNTEMIRQGPKSRKVHSTQMCFKAGF